MPMHTGVELFTCVRCFWRGDEDCLTYLLPPFGVGVGLPVCPECGAPVTTDELEGGDAIEKVEDPDDSATAF
ncbi:hypothetical protein [Megalodesulfovibrio paquesii]